MAKLVVIIQCELSQRRCSGFWCMKDFYERNFSFKEYPEDTRYMTFTCGGCCGNGLNIKIANLVRRLRVVKIPKEDVYIHLASCICSDNYHHLPCPNIETLTTILNRAGFEHIVKGSHISKGAQRKREAGIYKNCF